MRSYGYDDSTTTVDAIGEYRPYRGLLIGLFIALVVALLAGGSVGFVFLKYIDFADLQNDLPTLIAESRNFLVILLLVSIVVMFFAGRAVGSHAPGREGAYGVILATLVAIIQLFLYKAYDGFWFFPAWFNIVLFVTMYGAICLGAKSVVPVSALE